MPTDPFLDHMEWRCGCNEPYELDEAEDVAPAVGYPELERASDSRLQQAIASAYAVYVQRTIATR